ncbi:MAG: TIGR04295 family B12-binding domain-containing radical SAM protein [Acidiphilium sp.]|jgi:B12-binding domain/radical SAM domain protein of rhizo-twelve system|nr:TIGR04295 family B12-binding domain-containing radical SAM protein [Acidiphilium sp.]
MKIALINPRWDFANSIYFGCRAPHLPLELGYGRALLEQCGHEVLMLDGQIQDLTNTALAARVQDFAPAMTVVTTAPTYLFWRCAPPELRIPREVLTAIGGAGGMTVAVGPHGSATPAPVLRKLGVDLVIRGECEDAIAALAQAQDRRDIPGLAWIGPDGEVKLAGVPAVTRFTDTPALVWPQDWITRHTHHHHRFDTQPDGPGAEVEASRGCPYACTFCAKIDFRDSYRRRDLPILLAEIDALIAQGVTYLYFIDEIFLPRRDLLDALTQRRVKFGVQTRIDLWKPDMLDALGAAGCISIEAGIESLTAEGRAALAKKCRLDNDALSALLFRARRSVPFVQANLIKAEENEAENAISAARSSASPPGSATPSPSAANATSTPKFSKAIWPANSCSRRAAKHWPS